MIEILKFKKYLMPLLPSWECFILISIFLSEKVPNNLQVNFRTFDNIISN